MAGGRPTVRLILSDEERAGLERLVRSRKAAQAEATRARAVLLSASGETDQSIAKQVGLTAHSVGKWRKRFAEFRLAGLSDAPRSGKPRTISDEKVAEVIRLTLETKPPHATQWSTRSMAARVGVSNERVSRIWRAFGLQPHRSETFQLSTDPFFVEKVRDVVGLYLSPPRNALVLCVDEKSQCQALERSQPILPLLPGTPERASHDYFRHGTTTLFAALDVATGKIYSRCHARHRSREFIAFLNQLERETPPELDLHIVLDNYAAHKTDAVKRWLVKHPRWRIHFIPTHSSWLNQVERFFAKITTERIRRGSFRSLAELKQAITTYIKAYNENPKPFTWTASPERIFQSLQNYCSKLS
jgi:transposase